MTEIELKAHVDLPAETEARLRSFCTFAGETVKRDVYWENGAGQRARIREESGKSAVLTWKEKSLADGIEVNDEREITVSSAALMSDFLAKSGYSVAIKKEKHTKSFRCPLDPGGRAGSLSGAENADGTEKPDSTEKTNGTEETAGAGNADGVSATLELSEVTGLGFFLEIEICLDRPDAAQTARARDALRELLAKAGVPEAKIEPRYYTELLALKTASARKSSVAK